MFILAEAQCRDASEDELRPGEHGEGLTEEGVHGLHQAADAPVEALLKVELEVDAHGDLGGEDEEEGGREAGVGVVGAELAAAVHVAEEVAQDSEGGREDLNWDVPAALD